MWFFSPCRAAQIVSEVGESLVSPTLTVTAGAPSYDVRGKVEGIQTCSIICHNMSYMYHEYNEP